MLLSMFLFKHFVNENFNQKSFCRLLMKNLNRKLGVRLSAIHYLLFTKQTDENLITNKRREGSLSMPRVDGFVLTQSTKSAFN